MDRIQTHELHFTDEHGRLRFFNGMNIDDKQIGDVFRYPLDRAFFEKYTAKGFNLIRLAVTWANLEPQMGVYSESYLRSLDEIFRLAEEFGVYILLDMHQDLYSGFDGVGGGDGAPAWACLTDGKQPRDYRFVWAEAYFFGPWVHNCFDHFWNNDPVGGRGLQDRYADLWQMLARRYGESKALFGFDFLNEPAPGSLIKKTILQLLPRAVRAGLLSKQLKRRVLLAALLRRDMQTVLDNLPGAFMEEVTAKVIPAQAAFDKECYWPFLCKMAAAVREATPNGILMIEQPYLCNGGVRLSVPPIEVNGRREPLQCYGPHAYDFTVDTPLYQYANADRVKAFFNEMRRSQLRLNVPTIVGEWGGCSNNKDTSWFPHANELLDYFDSNAWGQLYWDYHGDDLDAPLMEMLSRTVPVAVAGTCVRFFRSADKTAFTLRYRADGKNETLIYAHKACAVETEARVRTVKTFENGASLLGIQADAGACSVVLRFAEGDGV